MPGIQQMRLNILEISAVRGRPFRREDEIVLSPDNQGLRLIRTEEGLKQAGRYQILPVAGQHYVTDEEATAKSPDFLVEELRTHFAQEPIKFRLQVQLPNPGDPTNDASIVWPDDRRTITLGTITITSVVPDSDAAQKTLAFDPIRLTNGIELSDDPLPALRSRVYLLSRVHRQNP